MKNRAFTLIELLAVIIILGILMLIAIPSVTSYINNSRKNTYVNTIDSIIKGTIAKVNSGDLNMFDTDTTYYVPCTCIKLENGTPKSPYGKFDPAYVVVTFDGTNYHYYFTGKDVQNMGVPTLTSSDVLSKESIVANVDAIDTSVGIEGTSNVYVFSDECNGEGEIGPAGTTVSGGSSSSSSGGGSSTTTCKKQTCPPVSSTIYWAIQDTNSDGIKDKLVISDSAVSGVLSGSASVNEKYDPWNPAPWGYYHNGYLDDDLKTSRVTKIEVTGKVAPIYLDYWFANVGSYADTQEFVVDLSGLYTCHTVSMRSSFLYTGNKAKKLEFKNICSLDTSNVTDMSSIFSHAGYQAKSWSIEGISYWDTSKVANMAGMFNMAGSLSSSFDLDLSGWNTSNVTNMQSMFYYAGENARSWSIGDISNWNTSKVTNMSNMFSYVGRYTSSFDLDLSGWNTSNVTSIARMFYNTGIDSSSFNLDLSGWNTSKLVDMDNTLWDAGKNASTWNIKIPKTNGNGLNNSKNIFYGSTTASSLYPRLGKYFTVAD